MRIDPSKWRFEGRRLQGPHDFIIQKDPLVLDIPAQQSQARVMEQPTKQTTGAPDELIAELRALLIKRQQERSLMDRIIMLVESWRDGQGR